MFADREKGINGKAKMERFKRERVHLVFAIKLQKTVGKKSMPRETLGLGREEGLFTLGRRSTSLKEEQVS